MSAGRLRVRVAVPVPPVRAVLPAVAALATAASVPYAIERAVSAVRLHRVGVDPSGPHGCEVFPVTGGDVIGLPAAVAASEAYRPPVWAVWGVVCSAVPGVLWCRTLDGCRLAVAAAHVLGDCEPAAWRALAAAVRAGCGLDIPPGQVTYSGPR